MSANVETLRALKGELAAAGKLEQALAVEYALTELRGIPQLLTQATQWLCPNAFGAARVAKHECVIEQTESVGWVVRCSCGYRAVASTGEVIEAERVGTAGRAEEARGHA